MFGSEDVALIMALPGESQGLFEKQNIQIHFCGIGKINAALKATEIIHKFKPKHILNLGTAGSHKFATHSLIECVGFVQRDMDLSPLGFPHGETPMDPIKGLIQVPSKKLSLPVGVCGTGDAFEVGRPKIECDLVDMEAYAIAKACKTFGVEFTAVKYITDGSDDNAHNDWRENLRPAAQALLEVYQRIVK